MNEIAKCERCREYNAAAIDFRRQATNVQNDYASLLARHVALVEAVALERECEELHGIITELYCNVSESAPEEDEISRTYFAARAEVDRLIVEGRYED